MKKLVAGLAIAGVVGALVLIGSVHVISGSALRFPKIVKKDAFGFRESFVSLDRIAGMPAERITAEYPVSSPVLFRKRIIWVEPAASQR
jgi:hypothetical protein